MNYQHNKIFVLDLFENYIIKYVVKDLEILDIINSDRIGTGGCAIPQAISTFAALDLIGYLIHTPDRNTVSMSFTELLKNETYFPEFVQYSNQEAFFESFRDNIRSILIHRYSLAKFDITKTNTENLFIQEADKQIFNASYFTKVTINGIKKIHTDIINNTFLINGNSKDLSMKKIKDRIEKLKDFEGNSFAPLNDLQINTATTQTTSSLG